MNRVLTKVVVFYESNGKIKVCRLFHTKSVFICTLQVKSKARPFISVLFKMGLPHLDL